MFLNFNDFGNNVYYDTDDDEGHEEYSELKTSSKLLVESVGEKCCNAFLHKALGTDIKLCSYTLNFEDFLKNDLPPQQLPLVGLTKKEKYPSPFRKALFIILRVALTVINDNLTIQKNTKCFKQFDYGFSYVATPWAAAKILCIKLYDLLTVATPDMIVKPIDRKGQTLRIKILDKNIKQNIDDQKNNLIILLNYDAVTITLHHMDLVKKEIDKVSKKMSKSYVAMVIDHLSEICTATSMKKYLKLPTEVSLRYGLTEEECRIVRADHFNFNILENCPEYKDRMLIGSNTTIIY